MIVKRRIIQLITLMAGLIPALCIPYGLGAGQEPGPGTSVYLPLVSKPPNTINGRVTYTGTVASGVSLDLRFYNGSSWSTLMSTTTNYLGNYQFQDVPDLTAGQEYLVRYLNTIDQSRLGTWETRHLTSLSSGNQIDMGSFEIANIALNSPINGYETSLPRLFTWVPRPASLSDSYKFNLFDPYDYTPKFTSPPLGFTDRYTLNSLPPGFNLCNPYYWAVTVDSPDGGWGSSLWAYEVTFYPISSPSGIYGCVTQDGVPATSLPVQLRRINILLDTDVLAGTVNTISGMFSFTGKPSTSADEYYLVRYVNSTNQQSRVSSYETNWLGPYQAGNTVHIGDFDIANIPLVAPGDGVTVTLPYTFQWTTRLATPTDDYQFHIFGAGGSPDHTSTFLGYTDHYNLNALPWGFSTDITYTWQVMVWDPFNGNGISYGSNAVTFASSGVGTVPIAPKDASGLSTMERLKTQKLESGDLDEPPLPMRLHPDYTRLRDQP